MDASGRRIFASLTPVDPIAIGESVVRLLDAGVDGIHLDIADGHFVPFVTFAPQVVESLSRTTSCLLDVHLLVDDPEHYIPALLDRGADRIAFHLEATRYPWRVVSALRVSKVEVGVAVNAITPLAALEMLAHEVDFVLVLATDHTMNGDHGLPGAAERVRQLRAMLPKRVRLEVDGGVTMSNIADFAAAGADDVVIGRALIETPAWGAAVGRFRLRMQAA